MNKRFRLAGHALAGLLWAGGVFAQAPDLSRLDIVERATPDGPVAMVDGHPVERPDFLFIYQSQLAVAAMQSGGRTLDDGTRVKIGLSSLAELIQREILWQEAQRRKLSVTDEELTKAYDGKLKGLQEELTAPGKTAPTEEEILARAGQTKDEAHASMRKTLLVNKVWEAIGKEAKVSVPEKDVEAFYKARPELFKRSNAMHLKQIFVRVRTTAKDPEEAAWTAGRERAEKAVARVRAGESFEAVARVMSGAPDAGQGGDMGMIPVGQLPPFYVEAARALKAGEISAVIRSEHGWHIVQMVSQEEGGTVSLADAHDRIKAVLEEAKTEEAVSKFCSPLLSDETRVKVFLRLESPPEKAAEQAGIPASDSPAKASQ